jgi:hypothetical protein
MSDLAAIVFSPNCFLRISFQKSLRYKNEAVINESFLAREVLKERTELRHLLLQSL